jgi:hypothetical protein
LHRQLKEYNLQLNQRSSEHQTLQGKLQLSQARESALSSELSQVKSDFSELQAASQRGTISECDTLLSFLKGDRPLPYPTELLPFYLLFGVKRQAFYEMLSGLLILPCWRIIQRMKEKFLQNLGFTSSLFDGEPANLLRLCALSNILPGSELILAVDAIAVGS